jgi:hypothetical protein
LPISSGAATEFSASAADDRCAIQHLVYEWDLNDNLTARRDQQQTPAVHETFTYDTLDRLDTSMRKCASEYPEPTRSSCGP